MFFHIFFANFWKFIETQGFLIDKIGRICKEVMIFEFFLVFYARKICATFFFLWKPEEGLLLGIQSLYLALDLYKPKCHGDFFNQYICMVVHLAPFLMSLHVLSYNIS